MVEPILTKEGQEVLDTLVYRRLPIVRENRKEEYFHMISLLMSAQGVKEAGRELVIEALKMVEGKGLSPIFDSLEDPAKFKKMLMDPMKDKEAYYALPRQVKRWKPDLTKPAKPPHEMKVLGICASPRKGGNTSALIDEALRGAKAAGAADVEKIMLRKPGFCLVCGKCKEPGWEGFCVQKDGMNDIFAKMIEADALIIGFPIYSGRESGQLLAFMDRWSCLPLTKFSNKRAMVICTWGYPSPDTYDFVTENIINILSYSRKIVTVEALSACGLSGMFNGLDEEGKAMILRYPKELEKAYQAGKTLVAG
jgi:multimeric flavodoxin WrbA